LCMTGEGLIPGLTALVYVLEENLIPWWTALLYVHQKEWCPA
jgi:hypothetical protein